MTPVPVFLINGMLDSGKSTFIQSIIYSDGFYKKGTTLLILLEEGENEYDKVTLYDKFNTTVLSLDDASEFPKEKFENMVDMYKFDRIIIENNAMSEALLELPENVEIMQIITLIDSTTFENYYANMRVKMADIIRPASVIIFNRIDTKMDKLLSFKRTLSLLNNEAEYLFQNMEGEIIDTLEEELPYNLNDPVIVINDDDYATFFMDAYDHRDRYEGKMVNFNAVVYTKDKEVIFGRCAMTCCENDITLLGFITNLHDKFKENTWVNVNGKVTYKNFTGEVEPALDVVSYKKIKQIKKPVVGL